MRRRALLSGGNIDYSDCFAMVVTVGGNIKWTGSTTSNTLSYSKDNGKTWTTANSGTAISVAAGDKVLWKGTPTPQSDLGIGTFSGATNTRYSVEGNVMSLLFDDDFKGQTSLSGKNYALSCLFKNDTNVTSAENLSLPATTLAAFCYYNMFNGCSRLTTTPQLPATTLAAFCYYNMFNGCSRLTTAPQLPVTTLATYCYAEMFNGCSRLTTAPALPATTLAISCYSFMFNKCTSLTTAPELPATTLVDSCYANMFNTCSSLNSIKCLATNISASYCTYKWISGVAASGTFTKAANMSGWTTGTDGIPSGWTVVDIVDYSEEYFTIVSLADNNVIKLKQTGSSIAKTVEVSTDKVTWTSYTSNTSGVTLATLSNGQKLYVRGSNTAYASSTSKYNTFTSTGNFDVEGNIMSLLYGDDFASKTTYPSTYTFLKLFESSKVVNAKNLILPATTARGRCYYAMFTACTSMITAPKLPAKTLETYCYSGMLYNTAITEAPELPATTLATYCYYRMFRKCTGLTKGPVLKAKTLKNYCYQNMFESCSNLNHVTMLATNISATDCLANWLTGVAATGTLVKDASMTTLPSGASGIPSGWTVRNA